MKNIRELFDNFNDNIKSRGLASEECEKIINSNQIIIYGCGNSGTVLYERMKQEGIEVIAFIDNGKSIYGKEYQGVPVFTNEEMLVRLEEDKTYVVIVTLLDILSYESIKKGVVEKLNIHNNLQVFFFTQFRAYDRLFALDKKPEFSAYIGESTNILLHNKEKILHVYDLLSDEMSKKCYLELLNYYIVSDFVPFTVLPFEEHYFAYDLYKKTEDEVFVDCGAFDGDTIDIFLKNQKGIFKKYIAIEADKTNYEKIVQKVNQIKNIEVMRSFISNEVKVINFTSQGTSYSRGGKGEEVIKTATLDELVYQYNPTFIKINIEGADVEAIMGAENIIKECMPIIAAQGHHKVEHLWEIIETIESFNKSAYSFYLRNYMGIDEFTFYAIPGDRIM